jgi:ferritin-like protein
MDHEEAGIMAGDTLHESDARLTPEVRDRHRALASLCEELEAIDWYDQRVAATEDPPLRAILVHNRDEEKEHAAMILEWLRRRDEVFDRHLRRILFQGGPIAQQDDTKEDGAVDPDGSLRLGRLT